MSEWLPLEEVQRLLVGVAILEPLPLGEARTIASDAALRRLGAGEDMLVTPQMHAQRTALLLEGRARVYEAAPPTGRSPHRWPKQAPWWGLRG